MFVLLAAGCAFAQSQGKNKGPQLRTVVGQVVDKDENPLVEAVIYLENMTTKSVQSHISDDKGDYDAAIAEYRKALALGGNDPATLARD